MVRAEEHMVRAVGHMRAVYMGLDCMGLDYKDEERGLIEQRD